MASVMTGARGKVLIGGKVVGFIGGVNVNVEDTLADVDIIGQLEVGDLAETGHKCNFSINYYKALADAGVASPDAKGQFIPNSASAIGIDKSSQAAGVSPMRSQDFFDVEITDQLTDQTIFKMEKCKWEGGSGAMDARGIWTGTWNFRAVRGFGL